MTPTSNQTLTESKVLSENSNDTAYAEDIGTRVDEPEPQVRPAIGLLDLAPRGGQIEHRLRWCVGGQIAPGGNRTALYLWTKRALDIIGALVVLVCLSPLLLFSLLVLSITTRGRPLYSQVRAGFLGRRFHMWKFRTMTLDADTRRHLVENEHSSGPIFKNRRDPRVTRVGRWLRIFSIDELPQLVNVLKGEMSLVGPRPPVPGEVAQYEPWQRRRLSVKPGLTGIWQVSGRSRLTFEDMVRMDLCYIDRQSLALDAAILLRTPGAVITCDGAC